MFHIYSRGYEMLHQRYIQGYRDTIRRLGTFILFYILEDNMVPKITQYSIYKTDIVPLNFWMIQSTSVL